MNAWSNRISGAGFLVAVVALLVALDVHGVHGVHGARGARIDEPGAEGRIPDRQVAELRRTVRELGEETRRLRVEVAAGAAQTSSRAAATTVDDAPRPVDASVPATKPAGVMPSRDEVFALLVKVVERTASATEANRFFGFARDDGRMKRLLDDLESEVAAGPSGTDARMRLAGAYVMKILTLPVGPEMARWGAKAEREWREVLRLDPSHRQARLSLAVSLSYHADVEGVTPEAIRHLNRLVEEQERMAPEPRQAGVFKLLAILHRRQGDVEAARRAIRRGLERHPEDAELTRADREDRESSEAE